MKVRLICIGKTPKGYLLEGEKIFEDRLKHYISFEKIEIPDIKNAKSLNFDQIKKQEGLEFLKKINQGETTILLDEKGKQYTSEDFAGYFQGKMNQGIKTLNLLIGGPYGFSDEIYELASGKISLSKMTFSHQMIRVFLMEQVYRAMTILRGEPYHHS